MTVVRPDQYNFDLNVTERVRPRGDDGTGL